MINDYLSSEEYKRLMFRFSKLNLNQMMQVTSGYALIEEFIDLEKTEQEFIQEMNRIKDLDNELDFLLSNSAPCPFCSETKLSFNYSTSYGHGDMGFSNLRISCNNCHCSKGNLSNYGYPTIEDKIKLLTEWNNRILKQ